MMMIGLLELRGLHNGEAGHLAEPGAGGAAAPYGPQIHALIISPPYLTAAVLICFDLVGLLYDIHAWPQDTSSCIG